jgi:hypothetical protein
MSAFCALELDAVDPNRAFRFDSTARELPR